MLVLAACGGGEADGGKDGPGPAEPAKAPPTSEPPAGTVEEVASSPQGIVYDPKTHLLAVAVHDPYRLLLLDPATLQVRTSVRLPGKVRHLQVAPEGGRVLVPSETANKLVEVSLPDGETRSTTVQRHPHDAAGAANGDVVVANEFSGSISLVRDGDLLTNTEDLRQPGGVLVDGGTVAVVDVRDFSLSTYALDSLERTGRIAAGDGPTHGMLLSGGRVAVSDTRGDQILTYTLHPLRQVGRLDLEGSPYGVASDPESDTAWVTLTARNQLVGLDVSGDTPKVIERYRTVRQPDTVAVAPGSKTLWVTGTADGVVQRITR